MSGSPSRLQRKEASRNLRQAVFFGGLTVVLALGLLFLGIPLLIKMAIFIGNLRQSYTPVETQDTLAPSLPVFTPLPEATNSAQIDLKGFSEPGASVSLFLNHSPLETVIAQSDGSFLISQIKLRKGLNEIYAKAADETGNESQNSAILTIVFDDQAPDLTITTPEDGAVFSSFQESITITGQTEPEATVTINDRLVIVDATGNFEYLISLGEGENLFKIIAQDQAGNQNQKEIKVRRE